MSRVAAAGFGGYYLPWVRQPLEVVVGGLLFGGEGGLDCGGVGLGGGGLVAGLVGGFGAAGAGGGEGLPEELPAPRVVAILGFTTSLAAAALAICLATLMDLDLVVLVG